MCPSLTWGNCSVHYQLDLPLAYAQRGATKLQTTFSIGLEPKNRWFQKRPKVRKYEVTVFGQARVRTKGGGGVLLSSAHDMNWKSLAIKSLAHAFRVFQGSVTLRPVPR